MKSLEAIRRFSDLDKKYARCVYSRDDLNAIFPEDTPRGLEKSIERLVNEEIIERVSRGIYVFSYAASKGSRLIESIASVMRRSAFNYVSLESALSEYGRISQIPVGVITIMTTGRAGRYKTPYGIIEFTHTQRSGSSLSNRISTLDDRPLPVATEMAALSDLKRVGRNLNMVDEQ